MGWGYLQKFSNNFSKSRGDTIDNINTKENRTLLYKYLKKYYITKKNLSEEQAITTTKNLMKKYKDNLFGEQGLTYFLGSKSLEFFCLYYLSNIYTGEDKAELAPIHHDIWQELEDIILYKTHDKQNYILPRGTGKSSFISLALSIWCSVYKYKRYIVICSAISDTAETFIRNIKMALADNKRIESSFGKIYDPRNYINNSEKVELANQTMIQSISASSTLRGKSYGNIRIELALLDDYQKDDQIVTHEQREKKWKRFNDDINYAMQKDNNTIIAVGTLQCKEDFYDRLRNSPIWKTRHEKGVLVDNIDELFNSDKWLEFKRILTDTKNEYRLDDAKEYYLQNKEDMKYPLLWQSYWDCLDYALSYYGNPASFKQEVQGDIENIGEKKFTTIITESNKDIESHNFSKTLLAVDPAGTRNKNGKQDYYAYAVCSLADNGIKYIRKGEIYKHEFEEYIKHTLFLLRKYTDITHLVVEKNTYSGADVIRLQELIAQDVELKSRNITFINFHQNANKDDKINTVTGLVNLGQVVFNEEDEEAIQQLREFAGAKFSLHDDFPDVMAEAVNRIDNIETIQQIKVTPNWFK